MSIIIPTKAALALKNAQSNFQFVKFESHKPKKKDLDAKITDSKNEDNQFSKKDVDLKKIRHEVVKFGMSGFDATKKEEAKIALAVSLGAKPPKREYLNYKDLMKKRKEEKQKAQEQKQQMMSKSVLQGVTKKKNKINKNNDVGHFLSSYGKVQKKDLMKNDNSNPKKSKKKKKLI
ncbi:uncharacterized protein C1orf131 homolog [Amyelois transitella]|uniref:uncharacterized protein C1orf131 homolog n=1 Tax=Amyelois transitella TaxID=680683 RepID=UPI00067B3EEB|nr:uncharacterized protein C1orf131 homolog [Amyelois transitella]